MVHKKKVVCVVVGLLLLAVLPLLGSDSKTFNLSKIDPGITRIEYRVGKSPWSEVDLSSLQIEVPSSSDELFLRQYSGRSIIGDKLVYHYDANLGTWVHVGVTTQERVEVTLSPYATAMFTSKALNHMYTLFFGVGLDSQFSFSFHRDLIFKFDLEARFAKSNDNIWTDFFFIYGGDVGVGYRFSLGDKFLLTPSLLYGLLFSYCIEHDLEASVYLQHRFVLDVEAGYKISSNMHVFVTPSVQFMLDSSRNGFLFGLKAGVGFVL